MTEENNLWAILYVSSAMKGLKPEDVRYFLQVSKDIRIANGLSGIVILAQNNVLVLQEGIKENVKSAFETDKKHPAHHSMIKLYDGPISSRYFEDFPLAFKQIGNTDLAHLDDFKASSNAEYLSELLQMDHAIPKIIKDFIKNNS